jgi:sodium transport system permease protein
MGLNGGSRSKGTLPSPGGVVTLLLVVAVLFLGGAFPLHALLGEGGLILAQILFLAVPPLLYVAVRRHDPVRTFSLRLPSPRATLGGVLLIAAGTPLAWFLAWLQGQFVPIPVEYLEAMAEMLTADSIPRYLWLLLMVAVTPAICEEILFRGAILAGLRNGLPVVVAVVLSGLVFGLFHLSPQTGFRILPTAWLGILLAWAVVASGSLPLAVLLHFLNNGAILTLAAIPVTRELVSSAEEAPPLILLPAALIVLAVALRLLGMPERPGGGPDPSGTIGSTGAIPGRSAGPSAGPSQGAEGSGERPGS